MVNQQVIYQFLVFHGNFYFFLFFLSSQILNLYIDVLIFTFFLLYFFVSWFYFWETASLHLPNILLILLFTLVYYLLLLCSEWFFLLLSYFTHSVVSSVQSFFFFLMDSSALCIFSWVKSFLFLQFPPLFSSFSLCVSSGLCCFFSFSFFFLF